MASGMGKMRQLNKLAEQFTARYGKSPGHLWDAAYVPDYAKHLIVTESLEIKIITLW